jgi:Rrf2 family protein
MLSMTKKTGYGLIALTHLARLPKDQLASAREIAEHYGIPQALLMNILKELASKGYVCSVRGARGGYRICCNPREVNFISLMEDLEGPMQLAECIRGRHAPESTETCRLMEKCPIADPVHRVHRKIRDFLSDLSLSDLMTSASANTQSQPAGL